jgi:hypothetical protein
MSDDFGTVNVRRGDRGREIEVLRQHYRRHREALAGLIAESPTDHLANEYGRLVRDIDASLAKLDEIEGKGASAAASAPGAVPRIGAISPRTGLSREGETSNAGPVREQTEPGARPLIPPPGIANDSASRGEEGAYEPPAATASSRLPIIMIFGLLVLGAIGYLIWHASSDHRSAPSTIVESPAPVTPATETTGSASRAARTTRGVAATPPSGLSVAPVVADFGIIRKGTRAARQFEITNNTADPVQIQVARSQCRCLFYEYSGKIPGRKKDTITVTIDGARVKSGAVAENVTVSAKGNASLSATFEVQAAVK